MQKQFIDQLIKALNFTPLRFVEPDSWIKHIPFAHFVVNVLKPSLIVELGVHTGNSLCTFSQSVLEGKINASCYGVDTFAGEKHAGFYDETIFENISSFVQKNFDKTTTLMRTTFDEAVIQFSDNSIDLLHIDGLHTYEAVKNDFETWLPKISKTGVILFHDTQVRRDDFGVWKLWEEIKEKYQYTYEFKYGYGLGVLSLSENNLTNILGEIDNKNIDDYFYPRSNALQLLFDKMKEELDYMQLFINNFNEEDSIKTFASMSKREHNFDLSDKENIHALRIDPIDDYAVLRLDDILIDGIGYTGKLESNAVFTDDKTYYFATADPQIYLKDVLVKNIDHIQVILEYLKVGKEALQVSLDKIVLQKNQLQDELTRTTDELTRTTDELGSVYLSNSWKMTRPIRKAMRIIKKVLKRQGV